MAWEAFMKQRIRPGDGPHISIQRKGVISLNHGAFEALDSPKVVELLYDPDNNRVGLRKVDPDYAFGSPVRQLSRGATWLISGKAFTPYYGINTETSRRWPAHIETLDSGARILMID